jgi:hypothetical protein
LLIRLVSSRVLVSGPVPTSRFQITHLATMSTFPLQPATIAIVIAAGATTNASSGQSRSM